MTCMDDEASEAKRCGDGPFAELLRLSKSGRHCCCSASAFILALKVRHQCHFLRYSINKRTLSVVPI